MNRLSQLSDIGFPWFRVQTLTFLAEMFVPAKTDEQLKIVCLALCHAGLYRDVSKEWPSLSYPCIEKELFSSKQATRNLSSQRATPRGSSTHLALWADCFPSVWADKAKKKKSFWLAYSLLSSALECSFRCEIENFIETKTINFNLYSA